METLIESIRKAVAPDATDEAKRVGADACRTILATLDATLQAPPPFTPPAAPMPMPDVAAVVEMVRSLGPEKTLDAVITRLRAALPEGTQVPRALAPVRFHIVPIHPVQR